MTTPSELNRRLNVVAQTLEDLDRAQDGLRSVDRRIVTARATNADLNRFLEQPAPLHSNYAEMYEAVAHGTPDEIARCELVPPLIDALQLLAEVYAEQTGSPEWHAAIQRLYQLAHQTAIPDSSWQAASATRFEIGAAQLVWALMARHYSQQKSRDQS